MWMRREIKRDGKRVIEKERYKRKRDREKEDNS
jgi:hypothetical protein